MTVCVGNGCGEWRCGRSERCMIAELFAFRADIYEGISSTFFGRYISPALADTQETVSRKLRHYR